MLGTSIHIQGLVQGVGFRPFIYQLATKWGVTGHVGNNCHGVIIHGWASAEVLEQFYQYITTQAPPQASIDSIQCFALTGTPPASFRIVASCNDANTITAIAPDRAVCKACVADIHNPNSRHFNNPFTSCMDCGARFSIVQHIPYDRNHTSMKAFAMCDACKQEYNDPDHRRFHAQSNSCADCGPHYWLEQADNCPFSPSTNQSCVAHTAALLQAGYIVAIKGIGGMHLAVDGMNHDAIERLRTRKQRATKPLALMAKDIAMIHCYAYISEYEQQLLTSTAAPIVLLDKKNNALPLHENIAPKQSRLGFMLPYSPFYHLLMDAMKHPIVLTSANRSNHPPCINNNDARIMLAGIADYFLFHDRDIVRRLDDSVLRVMLGKARFFRRARGYAPTPIMLNSSFANTRHLLAMGGASNNSFCQLRHGQATVSQYIGNLEHADDYKHYRETLRVCQKVYDFKPQAIAVDQHPDYAASQWGKTMAEQSHIPLFRIQHHHAHIAAVLAEHGKPINMQPILGIALDGLGLGADGTLWGGEFLLANYHGYQRLACFHPIPMLGGSQANIEPWRSSFAHLHDADWESMQARFSDCDIIRFLSLQPVHIFKRMINNRINTPLTSSCGRLFDAVAAILGICTASIDYDAQAAIELEHLAHQAFATAQPCYPYAIEHLDQQTLAIRWRPMWSKLLRDLQQGIQRSIIAARFHQTVIAAVSQLAIRLCKQQSLTSVVLCGGAFQNQLLLENISAALTPQGLIVLIAEQLPMNDGGLALGQAAIATAQSQKEIQYD